jgi:alpha-amylase/alpha-mannosidase (GH57 family)
MQDQTFLTKKDQLGYAEEHIIVEGKNGNALLNYSLSNSLEDIKIAIFSRTGHKINLDNAVWQINPELSISVKHLMNKHHVIYSMTTLGESGNKQIVVNMRANDKWFITKLHEFKGTLVTENQFDLLRIIDKIIRGRT